MKFKEIETIFSNEYSKCRGACRIAYYSCKEECKNRGANIKAPHTH
jgi:hypothetical protein